MSDLVNIFSQFKGLLMGDFIGGLFIVVCDLQIKFVQVIVSFICFVGFLLLDLVNIDFNVVGVICIVLFCFKCLVDNLDLVIKVVQLFVEEEVELEVLLLVIVKVFNLSIQKVDINFEMEVKFLFLIKEFSDYVVSMQVEMKVGWGIFLVKVNIQGLVVVYKEIVCVLDNLVKYIVLVLVEDCGMFEGLVWVMDILQIVLVLCKVGVLVLV